MIHRTSLFVFFDSPSPPSSPSLPPSPFRHAARLIVVCPYLPTYLPTCPSVASLRNFASTRALTISLRAIHDRFACRLVFSRHVFRSLPSISRVLSFVQRARGSVVVETVLRRTIGPRRILLQCFSCQEMCTRYVSMCTLQRGKRRLLF